MIYIIFLINSFFIIRADTLEIRTDVRILRENDITEQKITSILDLNRLLDGYLVFEMPDEQQKTDTNNFICQIYYLDSLSKNQVNGYKGILFNIGNELVIDAGLLTAINDIVYNNFRLIWKCFRAFNRDKSKECQPFLFDYGEGFKTDIFKKNTLIEKDLNKYFIYKIKLNAWVYEYYENDNSLLLRTFIPLTELKYFAPANIEELEKYGFKKSNTVVKFY